MPEVTLTDGSPVPEDGSHTKLKANGQQEGYVVLSAEERHKGFVRPMRYAYVHVGMPQPKNLRDLTADEVERFSKYDYAKFEVYPPERSPITGRFWTNKELAKISKGCGVTTTMSQELAETYARMPGFYSGTFCAGCGVHLPVGENGEFVWANTNERVGT